MDNGNKKIKDPASRGPNPAIAIGNDANKKTPGTTNKTKRTFTLTPTATRQTQKLSPKRICDINERKIVFLL